MSRALAEKFMTEAEYLAFDEKSKIRYECMDGEIFAMAGASRRHNSASANISRELGNQLLELDWIKCKVSLKMIYLKMNIAALKLIDNKKKVNGRKRG